MTVPVKNPRVIAALQTGPGPGKYMISGTCDYREYNDTLPRKKPAYSIAKRYKHPMDRTETLGPGPKYKPPDQMTRYGPEGFPKYSMRGTPWILQVNGAPGPGKYRTEDIMNPREKRAPKYTLRKRWRNLSGANNPAPNTYTIQSSVGGMGEDVHPEKERLPVYTMRPNVIFGSMFEDKQKTPGPVHDEVPMNLTKKKLPHFTAQARTKPAGVWAPKCGPLDHHREDVVVNKPIAPKFTMGRRHSAFAVVMYLRPPPGPVTVRR